MDSSAPGALSRLGAADALVRLRGAAGLGLLAIVVAVIPVVLLLRFGKLATEPTR
jgi:hypothetical protein